MADRAALERQLAQIAEARRLAAQSKSTAPSLTQPSIPRESLEAELAKIQAARAAKSEQKKEGFTHRLGQFARGLASGIGAESDINAPGNPLYAYPSDYEEISARPTVAPMSQELPRVLGLGEEYEPQKGDTLGKIINFSGEMIAPSSMMPLGGYAGLLNAAGKGAKALGKAAAKEAGIIGAQAAAIKGTPRLTQEGTGLGAIEDLSKGYLTGKIPGWGKKLLGKKVPKLDRNEKAVHDYLSSIVGEENIPGIIERLRDYKSEIGYEPLTAEVAGNPVFAQLQRAMKGVAGSGIAEKEALGAKTIAEALQNSKLPASDMSDIQNYFINRLEELEQDVHTSTQTLNPKLNETESGRSVQNALHDELMQRKGERRKVTKPLYDEVKQMEEALTPKNTLEFLDNEVVRGDLESDSNWVRKMIDRPSREEKSQRNAVNQMKNQGFNEKAIEAVENSIPSASPSIAELAATRKAINARIQEYRKAGKEGQARFLREIRTHLDKDLENISLQREANEQYRELSVPVSKITKNKALNSVTKKLNDQFLMSESRVPGVFINNTAGSIDDSRALLRELQNKPGALHDVRSYLNNLASLEIIDETTGLVNSKKLDAFKKKYPGAKVLYPELYDTKLKDIKSSQMMVDKFLKNIESVSDTFYKDAFGQYVGKDPSKIIKKIFSGDSGQNMKQIMDELPEFGPAREDAKNALRNETIKYFEKSITNAGSAGEYNKLSYPKTKKFLEEHKSALEQVLTENQMTVTEEVGKIASGKNYASTEGMSDNSHTHANIRNALDFSKKKGYSMPAIKALLTKIGVATPFAKEFFKDMRELQVQKNKQILSKVLRDKDYADYLLSTPLKSKEDFMNFIEKSKSYSKSRYVPPVVRELMEEKKD